MSSQVQRTSRSSRLEEGRWAARRLSLAPTAGGFAAALSCVCLLGAQTPPAPPLAATASTEPPIRVLLRARNGGADRLTSLRYIGGFETKTMLYETLVRRGPDGRIAPGLASRWVYEDGGRVCVLQLREGAVFHDGKPVTAEVVRVHFQRWIGLPEHDWLACNRRIVSVEADGPRTVRITMNEPYALLDDLCAINPCAVVGPGARDWEGEFQRPMGTGPFRFVAATDQGASWRLARAQGGGADVEVSFVPRGRDRTPVDRLLAGSIDVFVGGWDEDLPAAALREVAADPRFVVQTAPGSSVAYLSFRLDEGPTADREVRRRIQVAVDRAALIASVEDGRADACTAWAAPSVSFWPRGRLAQPVLAPAPAGSLPKLTIAAGPGDGRASRIAQVLQGQLQAAGFPVEVLRPPAAVEAAAKPAVAEQDTESGDVRRARLRGWREIADLADLRIQITHGVPYDPHQSLVARFGPVPAKNADQPRPRQGVDPALQALVALAMVTADENARIPIYAEIQALLDREVLIVPLYSPHRVVLRRAAIEGIGLDLDCYRADLTGLRRITK